MTFSDFLLNISSIRNCQLPGLPSQLKLSPPERAEIVAKRNISIDANPAAVLVLIYPKDNISTIALIVRNAYNGVHSNQIGFPGGKPETADANLFTTALRECQEEIGVNPDTVTQIRYMTPLFIPPSNFLVSPFLAYVDYTPNFHLDKREVVALIEMPLYQLLSDENLQSKEMATSYSKLIDVPIFKFNDYNIWGATAMMLSELKDLINSAKSSTFL